MKITAEAWKALTRNQRHYLLMVVAAYQRLKKEATIEDMEYKARKESKTFMEVVDKEKTT
jgi:hypothetical protein